MPTTATLAPPATFSHSGGCPSHFVNQNKTARNFAPYRTSVLRLAKVAPRLRASNRTLMVAPALNGA
jgi:hypothetical protein